MQRDDIKKTLSNLHQELEHAPEIDEELRSLLREVDDDIHELLGRQAPEASAVGSLTERVDALAADFAARHPASERFFRELIDALGRLGI
ncbi:MAG: DUF4404 family protein [Pseudomonadales bacterium]